MHTHEMEEKPATVPIGLAFQQAPPSAVDAGTKFSFSAELNWPKRVARKGARFLVRDGEHAMHEGALAEPTADDDSVPFTLRAPDEVGEHRLTLVVASAEEGGEQAEARCHSCSPLPHETSLAVWDVPSPIVRGASFEIKAGAKCSASCGLAGKVIEIRDEQGTLVGSSTLNEATLPGTTALYFTALSLRAPDELALHAWTASFAPPELKLPHGGTTSRFSFVTVVEPEHSVSVKVVNRETKAPIAGAQIRIGVYRAVTDNTGAATVSVPKGAFPLVVTRPGYQMPERRIKVAKDVRIRIAAEKLPPEDPFALWTA
jgi:hypothetical protein